MKKTLSLLACLLLAAGCASVDKTTTTTTKTDTQTETATSGKQNATVSTNTTTSTTDDTTKDDEFEIAGTTISTGKTDLSSLGAVAKITAGGTYELTGTGTTLVVDAAKQDVTIKLDNATLEGGSLPALYVKKAASVTIELSGENTMTYGSSPTYDTLDACLYSKADLILKGNGSLSIQSNYEHGIKAKDTGTFESGTYTIQAQNDGIHVNEEAVFNGGTYTIAVYGEGIESKTAMTINDGDYAIHAYDDGINAINSLIINGGTITVVSDRNDGIDSNGDLIINGGAITSIGANAPETAFDTDNTPFEINGGSVLGIGAVMTVPTNAKQPVLLFTASQTVSTVELKADGQTVATFTTPSYSGNGTSVTVSAPGLKAGQTCEIYVNGSLQDSLTLSDGINTIGSLNTMGGGMMGGGMMGGRGQRGF